MISAFFLIRGALEPNVPKCARMRKMRTNTKGYWMILEILGETDVLIVK
jgi:hypothetical protein